MTAAHRAPVLLAAVLVFALTSAGLTASTSLPIPQPQVSQVANVTSKLDQSELRTGKTKDPTDKRLRMRQVLLLWLLAAQPAR
jgi:hypothetical protein